MAQQGWIKIHRKIKECYLWDDKEPFDKRSAWIDIILSANHADNKTLINNSLVMVLRGTFITSEVKLAERWKWDRGKVRRFLKLLENDNMIKKTATSRLYITIKVEHYDDYQSNENTTSDNTGQSIENTCIEDNQQTSNDQVKNKSRTSHEQVTNINKNDKECIKNEKNKYMSDSNEYRLADYLYRHMLRNNPKAKEPNYQTWCKQFHLILKVDDRELEEVKKVIEFCQKDEFWYKNILSPGKLREKYDQLILKMNDNKKPSKSSNSSFYGEVIID